VEVIEGIFTDSSMEMLTESPRDSKRQLLTVTWPIHRWKMMTESPRDSKWQHCTVTCPVCRHISRRNHRQKSPPVKPSTKINISPLTRPYPPLFLLLLPHLNSPQLQTTSAPPPKISLFSTQQVIYLEVFLSQHPCFDLPKDFYQFL
jgi:hypothetical protein